MKGCQVLKNGQCGLLSLLRAATKIMFILKLFIFVSIFLLQKCTDGPPGPKGPPGPQGIRGELTQVTWFENWRQCAWDSSNGADYGELGVSEQINIMVKSSWASGTILTEQDLHSKSINILSSPHYVDRSNIYVHGDMDGFLRISQRGKLKFGPQALEMEKKASEPWLALIQGFKAYLFSDCMILMTGVRVLCSAYGHFNSFERHFKD